MNSFIITAADAKYFELVQGTILSIRDKPQGQDSIIGFLDLGCNSEQLQWLQQKVDIIKQAEWEFDFPGKSNAPEYLKGLFVRPFFRQYFPGYDIYFWIDGDAWVQDWKAIELFLQGAVHRGLSVVPEIDRGNQLFYGRMPGYWEAMYQHYQAAFGKEIAEKFYNYPMLNAEVFALHAEAPHWNIWADCMNRGLQKYVSLMTDQLALNFAVYGYRLFEDTEMLPAWCNWTCHYGWPAWDKTKLCFVEPYLPHTPIGILHLTIDKHDFLKLETTDRDTVEVSLRYTPLSKIFKLQEINLLVCPKWEQPEAQLLMQLETIIKSVSQLASRYKTTLLIDISKTSEEKADLVLSTMVLNLFLNENYSINDGLEISLIGHIESEEWHFLRSAIDCRIAIENEDRTAFAYANAESLLTCQLEDLQSLKIQLK